MHRKCSPVTLELFTVTFHGKTKTNWETRYRAIEVLHPSSGGSSFVLNPLLAGPYLRVSVQSHGFTNWTNLLVSPVKIYDVLVALIGRAADVKKIRSGALLVLTQDYAVSIVVRFRT